MSLAATWIPAGAVNVRRRGGFHGDANRLAARGCGWGGMAIFLVARAGNSETRLLVLLMLAVAGLGSVMSSTGVVAIFIPVALSVAARIGIGQARVLLTTEALYHRKIEKIRASYTQDDEMYLARIGVGAALGIGLLLRRR